MGGQDKPLLPWRGRTMLEHVLASVPAAMHKLISANRNLAVYAQSAPVLEDSEVLAQSVIQPGPLVGVLAGLRELSANVTQQWLLISPGDTPCLADNWWQVMQQTAVQSQAPAVVAHDGERQQHLHMLLHISLTPALLDYLVGGEIAVFRWLQQCQAVSAQFSTPAAFRNINQPADFREA